jgi:EAL domain-containing protein (putative c-di-GMP-specific phosphodiesterase class I)
MLNNRKSERVVELIIQLAEQLNVSLIAEGVETVEALEKLYSMGCLQIQGYYFSRPEIPYAIINNYYNALALDDRSLNNETMSVEVNAKHA